ncbi:MAG: cbb3-type cytochrome c oxidase subunit I [Myxococcales bacterium]|nr:MAG: cbb3-type cytochrome c oxidase subunit I [Myxococcales bacterium]
MNATNANTDRPVTLSFFRWLLQRDTAWSALDCFGRGYLAIAALAFFQVIALRVPALFHLQGRQTVLALQASDMILVFLFIIPTLFQLSSTFILKSHLDETSFAMPKIAIASFFLYLGGTVSVLTSVALQKPTELSRSWLLQTSYDSALSGAETPWLLIGIALIAVSLLLSAINVVSTIYAWQRKSTPSKRDLPASLWSLYAHSLAISIASPVLVLTMLLTLAERSNSISLFRASAGEIPFLFYICFGFRRILCSSLRFCQLLDSHLKS